MAESNTTEYARKLFDTLRDLSKDGDGVTRPSYSKAETVAMNLISDEASRADLEISVDDAANRYITLAGKSRDLRVVYCGSHLDSVPCGGNYDGAAGIVAGLIALRNLKSKKIRPKRSIKLVMLRGEESAWFGKCYLGSLGLFGKLTKDDLLRKRRDTNRTLQDHMWECGANIESVTSKPSIDPKRMHAYLELHIEQGPVLERVGVPVGIVTGIRGNIRHNVECHGEAGHSGTTPMESRHDAVAATVEYLAKLRYHAIGLVVEGRDLVFTVGKLHTDAERDAVSVIPDLVKFTLEWRSLDTRWLDWFNSEHVRYWTQGIESSHRVYFSYDNAVRTYPALMDPGIMNQLLSCCHELKLPYTSLPSGAGHDAAVFAAEGVPSGMIFVRNSNGSHNPREAMNIEDFESGVRVLENALLSLADS